MNATFLSWDSDFFGRKVYKLEVETKPEKELLTGEIERTNGDLYYIFSKENHDVFYEIGAKLVDTKLVFATAVTDPVTAGTDSVISYTHEETTHLLDLAILSGTYSRFRVDEKIAYKYEELYSLWLARSLSREIADEVFIYKSNDQILGFISIKKNSDNVGVIGLIAVSENEQGKGIGKQLINRVKMWCYDNGIEKLTVTTQKENEDACWFYKRCGFSIDVKDFIYHYHRY